MRIPHISIRARIYIMLALLSLSAFGGGVISVFAQSGSESSISDREAALRAELAEVEKEIEAQQEILYDKQREAVSLERDIAILNAEISEARLQIRKKNLTIQQLEEDIGIKSATVDDLSQKLERHKESLAQLLRKTQEIDSFSLVEVMLSNKDFSEFFEDLDSFDTLKRSLNESYREIVSIKDRTKEEKAELEATQNAVIDARQSIEAEKRKIESKENEKQELLAVKRQEEKTYQQIVNERKTRAAQIRSALFALRDTAAIPFGDALQYAREASRATGVRPAFLLAILKQESNLGENVGTCNRPGDPPDKSWKEIMPGEGESSWRNDESKYLQLMNELGYNPDTMPLSCPWQGGWGGAMGPSQFIPTTWMSYKSRIENALGVDVADPWKPRHAFTASSLYLADLGASAGGYTAERRAALKYYAGSNWDAPKNQFYGDGVMQKAQDIQTNMIDPLENL